MNWRKVTEADVEASLSHSEIDAFRRSAAECDDPVEAQIADTVAYVRGIVRSSPAHVRMDPDASTLPASLIRPAMDYLRYAVLTRQNVIVNESRTKAYEKACELFDDVRAGRFIPESVTEDPDAGTVAGSPVAGSARPPRLLD